MIYIIADVAICDLLFKRETHSKAYSLREIWTWLAEIHSPSIPSEDLYLSFLFFNLTIILPSVSFHPHRLLYIVKGQHITQTYSIFWLSGCDSFQSQLTSGMKLRDPRDTQPSTSLYVSMMMSMNSSTRLLCSPYTGTMGSYCVDTMYFT